MKTPKRGDRVEDATSKITIMAVADEYVMCRRPGCTPFVRTIQEWNKLVNMKSLKAGCLTPDARCY